MRTEPPKTARLLAPAVPRRRRTGPAPTSLRTRRDLRAPAPPPLVGSVETATTQDERCPHRSGVLRCVRTHHADAPGAHVMVAGVAGPASAAPAIPTSAWDVPARIA